MNFERLGSYDTRGANVLIIKREILLLVFEEVVNQTAHTCTFSQTTHQEVACSE